MFDVMITRVLSHEGGFTRNPADRGNWTGGKVGVGKLNGTKYGISAMSYPNLDIANLTWGDACAVYKRDFWDRVGCDRFEDGVAYQLLDYAVNSGPVNAIKSLQRAIGVAADGVFGPKSAAALSKFTEAQIIMGVLADRLELMAGLVTFATFGRGWVRRVATNLKYAIKDVT